MNSFASTTPAVAPGEHIDGFLGPVPGGTPIWHFQDDAVTGQLQVDHLSTPMGQIMPIVAQRNFAPTRYLPFADGPPPIGNFSKDLAFELYTIPEPSSMVLLLLGLTVAQVYPRRRRRK